MIILFALESNKTVTLLDFPVEIDVVVRVSPCNKAFKDVLVSAVKEAAVAYTLETDVSLVTIM